MLYEVITTANDITTGNYGDDNVSGGNENNQTAGTINNQLNNNNA